jgi:hypothetical protein
MAEAIRYMSTFSVSFDASDDRSANEIAQQHHEQIRNCMRVEGPRQSHDVTLEQVVAIESAGSRTIPTSERSSKTI